MTPKEHAEKLVDKFYSLQWQIHKSTRQYKITSMSKSAAKQCAIIAVDEILKLSYFEESQMTEEDSMYKNYWEEVKQEIEKL